MSWTYRIQIFEFMLAPAAGALSPFEGMPVYTNPTGMFLATFGLVWRGAIVFMLPVVAISVYTLLSEYIPLKRKLFFLAFVAVWLLCFGGGFLFTYRIFLPNGLTFLLHFGEGIAVPVIDISKYLNLIVALLFWMSMIFTLPPSMFVLAKFDVVSYRRFRRIRKFVPFSAIILAIFLTPTVDPFNMFMMAGPMWGLYEAGVFAAWLAHPEDGNYMWVRDARWWMAGLIVLLVLIALMSS